MSIDFNTIEQSSKQEYTLKAKMYGKLKSKNAAVLGVSSPLLALTSVLMKVGFAVARIAECLFKAIVHITGGLFSKKLSILKGFEYLTIDLTYSIFKLAYRVAFCAFFFLNNTMKLLIEAKEFCNERQLANENLSLEVKKRMLNLEDIPLLLN